jgi:tripartite-type tricarboxylate transporter receptor subunit TctC
LALAGLRGSGEDARCRHAAVADPVVRQKLIDAGAELLQSSPQEMADHMRKEAAKWAEVIRTANIQLD